MSAILSGMMAGIRSGVYGGTTASLAATAVLSQAGVFTVTDFVVTNTDTSNAAYVQIWDKATAGAVTVGSTSATWLVYVPAAASATAPASAAISGTFTTTLGLVYAATTTATGATPAVTPVTVGYATNQ